MNCPLCECGHTPTKKVFLPLVDPKTGIQTGEMLMVSSKIYDQILTIANASKKEIPCAS